MKKWLINGITGLLCLNLLMANFSMVPENVYAVEVAETEKAKEEEKIKERPTHDKDGKPILSEGAAGLLMDGKTGNVLYEYQSKKKMYPASTTKIMTAILALEAVEAKKVAMDQKVTITAKMLENLDWDGSSIALQEGEIISFQDLLYGMMIASGNDASVAIAYTVSGSETAFVDAMNRKAKEMGLEGTKFKNPHGFHHKDHYTTVEEMGKMAYYAMKKPEFRDIVNIAHIKIPPTNKTPVERYYINTNGLVSAMRYTQYYYKGANGIKTGYTDDAKNCLVASAQRGDVELITVLFHGNGVENSHKDSIRMLDYGFAEFELITPVKKDQILGEVKVKWAKHKESVTTSAVEAVSVLVPKGTKEEEVEVVLELPEFVKAPVEKGNVVGGIAVQRNGEILGRGEMYADLTVERSILWPLYAFFEWLWSFVLIRILCYLILAAAGVIAVLLCLRFRKEILRALRKKKGRKKSAK